MPKLQQHPILIGITTSGWMSTPHRQQVPAVVLPHFMDVSIGIKETIAQHPSVVWKVWDPVPRLTRQSVCGEAISEPISMPMRMQPVLPHVLLLERKSRQGQVIQSVPGMQFNPREGRRL